MGTLLTRNSQKPKDQDGTSIYTMLNNENPSLTQSITLSQIRNQKHNTHHNTYNRQHGKLENQMQLSYRKQEQQQKWYQKIYFTPQSKFILIWKTVTLVLIYLYFLEIPITIAFGIFLFFYRWQKNIGIKIRVKGFFRELISLLLLFLYQVSVSNLKLDSIAKIILNYVLYILLFDFLSITSIVFYQFSQILRDRSQTKQPNSYRYIVILFYLKIPELFNIQRSIVASFDLNRRVKAFFKLFLLMTKIFMLCNVAACCFFYISDTTCPIQQCDSCCWVSHVEIYKKPLKQAQWIVQYTFSLYWASTTMLTIGYGDITPQNLPQAAYTVSAQFISCVLFAFSINQIWSIIQEKNSKRSKIHSRMNIINVYMRDKNVTPQLKSRVNAYLSHFYHTKNLRQKQLQHEIISQLTPSLRKQLYYESYGFLFHTHNFFKSFTSQFLQHVSQHIRQIGFFQQQIIASPQNQQPLNLYYIHKGQIQSFIQLGNFRTSNVILQQFQKGSIIGLYQFMRQINYISSFMALKYTLLYALDYQNWISCIKEYEEDYQNYFVIKHNALYQGKNKKMKLECKLCGSQKHQSDTCLTQQIKIISSGFLSNYLKKSQRVLFKRRNFKNPNQHKSQVSIMDLSSSHKLQHRKNSTIFRRESLKSQSQKKKIFQKKTHRQRMNKIIQKQIKQSIVTQQSQSDSQFLAEVVQSIDSVQNYDHYWPIMNANTDWGKERRRNTFNRLLIKN